MDPFEQRLVNEVIYLHSLWHQGPPKIVHPVPVSISNSNSRSNNLLDTNYTHNSTVFKNRNFISIQKKKEKKKKRDVDEGNKIFESDPKSVSDKEWPCEQPEANSAPTSWPELKKCSSGRSKPASEEDKLKLLAAQVQQKSLEACREFFKKKGEESDTDEEDGDEEMEGSEGGESKICDFLLKLFTDDNVLRGYYEKNFEGGEFFCLVCCGIEKRSWKRFKNCVALVQHATAISKTAKRRAHRAYGRVICKVLGWDANRLPTIVLSHGDSLSRALAGDGELQVTGGLKTVFSHFFHFQQTWKGSNVENGEVRERR